MNSLHACWGMTDCKAVLVNRVLKCFPLKLTGFLCWAWTTVLGDSGESLLDSGRHVTFQIVKELALNHRVLSRKGLMHLDSGFKVDHASRVTPKSDSKLDAVIRATGVKCQLSFKQDVYTYPGIVSWLAAPVCIEFSMWSILTHLIQKFSDMKISKSSVISNPLR
uniref:Uncharacterized protein n=1 Tax=Oncorhynchus tshawytscha TaxID=74940 RepID=A0A8C8D136_ONCTS